MTRKNLFAVSAVVLAVAVAPACASKGFVRTEVGNVNDRVDTLSTSLEETQEQTRQNETRIGAVDEKAEAAGRSAADARTAAGEAQTAADAAAGAAEQVDARVSEVDASMRRLIYEVTLSEDQGNFQFGGAELPDAAKARLDQLLSELRTDPQGVYIEIEGHTDSVGAPTYNQQLGAERAEAVKLYLYQQHQVPLHKINTISYGEDRPVGPNNTREGRAQNRRVVVRVLS